MSVSTLAICCLALLRSISAALAPVSIEATEVALLFGGTEAEEADHFIWLLGGRGCANAHTGFRHIVPYLQL